MFKFLILKLFTFKNKDVLQKLSGADAAELRKQLNQLSQVSPALSTSTTQPVNLIE